MKFNLKNIIPIPLLDRNVDQSALWGKDLSISFGDYVHVNAPSGTGKTSLMNILYGLRTDFNGELALDINDEQILDWDVVRTKYISTVFQDLKLLENESALVNILLKNQLFNHLSNSEIEESAKILGIASLLNRKIKEMSRGERQRVAILRALCMPFSCILLDEPFSHLDAKNANAAAGLILKHAVKNNAGIVMANLFQDDYFPYHVKYIL